MTKEDKLLLLQCLENAGVDSWDGYEDAVDEYNRLKYGVGDDSLDAVLAITLEEDDYE